MGACDDCGAAVVWAKVGEIGKGFDEGEVVEPIVIVAIGRVDASMKAVLEWFLFFGAANMRIGLLEARWATDNFFCHANNVWMGDVVEETGCQVG
jgi:hypothetical protein